MIKILILSIGLFIVSNINGQVFVPLERLDPVMDTTHKVLDNQFSDYVDWLKLHPQDTTNFRIKKHNTGMKLIFTSFIIAGVENFVFSMDPLIIFCTILPISLTGTIISK